MWAVRRRGGSIQATIAVALLLAVGASALTASAGSGAGRAQGSAAVHPDLRPHDPFTYGDPTPANYTEFGRAVAVSGSNLLVSAPGQNESGLNGAGAVYLFKDTTSALLHTFTSPSPTFFGLFGFSVAISGHLVVIGAPGEPVSGLVAAGVVYVYSTSGALIATLVSPSPQTDGSFGVAVSVSGSTVAVGAPYESASGQLFTGNVYVFRSTGVLVHALSSPVARYYGNDNYSYFGFAVALSGSTLAVGAPFENAPNVAGAGHVYLFKTTTGVLEATLTSPNPTVNGAFGDAVGLSGKTLVLGAPGEEPSLLKDAGRAYIYDVATAVFTHTLVSPNLATGGEFGAAVAVSKGSLVIGADNETVGGAVGAGRAYTFTTGGVAVATLASPVAQTGGAFGFAVGVGGKTVAVGALGETDGGYVIAGHVYQS